MPKKFAAAALAVLATTAATGDEILMIPADGSEVAIAIRDQFVSPMTGTAETAFAWARHDIDGDGYDELLVRLDGQFCTEGGCATFAFRRAEGGNWPAILTVMADTVESAPGGLVTVSGGVPTEWAYDTEAGALLPPVN
jgi:hypothetical protein